MSVLTHSLNGHELRAWQVEVQQSMSQWLDEQPRNKDRDPQDKCFVVEAVMGAGKTFAMGALARLLLDKGLIDNVLVLVPLNNLKQNAADDLIEAWDLHLWAGSNIIPAFEAENYNGQILLYQSLTEATLHSAIGYWTRRGQRLLVIADEVHHGSAEKEKAWGEALAYAIKHSEISILLSGTFWRSDGHRIPGANYRTTNAQQTKGLVQAHYSYQMERGQRDGVVSLVFFDTKAGTVSYTPAKFPGEVVTADIDRHQFDESGKPLFTGEAYRAFLSTNHQFAEEIIRKCQEELHKKRLVHFEKYGAGEDAPKPPAALAVARSTKEARHLANLISRVTGNRPPIVDSAQDDPVGDIAKFRQGIGEWIVAVKMISEGTDIPRLKVLAYFGSEMTQLVFHQVVGRIMRVRKDKPGKEGQPINEDGYAFIPEHPKLYRYVKEFRDAQVETDLTEKGPKGPCPKCGQDPCICIKEPPKPCSVCGKHPCICPKPDPFIEATKCTKTTTHLYEHEGVNPGIIQVLESLFPKQPRSKYVEAAITGYDVLGEPLHDHNEIIY